MSNDRGKWIIDPQKTWVYEDELSPIIPESIYTQWYSLSHVIYGVRMGPAVLEETPVASGLGVIE